jgi:dihydropyrimidinase
MRASGKTLTAKLVVVTRTVPTPGWRNDVTLFIGGATSCPAQVSEGVAAGRISLDRFVALTSANAARIFDLYPRKGTIAVGSDADIALWDPGHRRTIDGARMRSRSGYSVYDGWQVQGWPRFVVRRGQVVLADGQITARPGDGRWLRRNTTAGVLPSRPRRRS